MVTQRFLLLAYYVSSLLLTTNAFTSSSLSPLTTRSRTCTTPRRLAAAAALSNPFQQLPWNVRKQQEREARRLEQERAILHRQLGIPEDATYEEIVDATNRLIALADGDVKQKIRIEVAKDKILQHRLNERLAGYRQANKDARAQSQFEEDGADDEDDIIANKKGGSAPPAWTKGLIVSPDRAQLVEQFRLWGIMTAIGVCFPPSQEYLQRFTWLICVAQLTFRGMPKGMREGGGMGSNFSSGTGTGGGHRKLAFMLGLGTWVAGSLLAYGFLPKWARGQRWTNSVAFTIQNMVFAAASSYLQPYKG